MLPNSLSRTSFAVRNNQRLRLALLRFCLRFPDVEELLAKRGIIVSQETTRQWCLKFAVRSTHANRNDGKVAYGIRGF